ncbi:reverse transcriptase domain-containing protein, partial [Clostridioides difficile]|uniref:reverse transcriptase domain-containing protein n=1 Tax=Clostridioides difficile TaxID=1496 RepID=UPI001FDA7B2A
EMYIVRYADDFKILCKNRNHAKRIFTATNNWLKERLGLEISEEKSKITDIRYSNSEFLGFKLKAYKKKKKYVIQSSMTDKIGRAH